MALTQHQALTGAELHVPQVHDLLRHIIGGVDSRLQIVRAYRSANYALGTGAWTTVQLNAETADTGGEFDTGAYLFTAAQPGWRLVIGQFTLINANANSAVSARLRHNGAQVSHGPEIYTPINGATPAGLVEDIIYFAAGDTLDLQAWHNNVGAKNIAGGSAYTYLSIIGGF